jgi:ferritin-like metal-binding protein YciE
MRFLRHLNDRTLSAISQLRRNKGAEANHGARPCLVYRASRNGGTLAIVCGNMSKLKELLVDSLQDLLHAETQLVGALPKMAAAAHHPKLKEGFEKHLGQTQVHVERLKKAFQLLGEKAEPTPCKAMLGLIEEGSETIEEGKEKEPLIADLALIAIAQKVEHYEISGYGTVRGLARQTGELEVAELLAHTLGDEESTDFLLTAIAKPLLQQASLDDLGANVNLEDTPQSSPTPKKRTSR